MKTPQTKLCVDKLCLRAGEQIPLTQFPRNKSRPGGRHGYCLVCALRRTREYRDKLRAMKAAQKLLRVPQPVKRKPDVIATVAGAILSGASTREQLRQRTRLNYNVIGDALCYLVFDARRFRFKRTGGRREIIAA